MVELKITVDDEGHVQVSGPLADKILCVRLLNVAYDEVQKYNPAQDRIVKPNLVFRPSNGS